MKKLTVKQKYNSLKKQTEQAGMKVTEKDGKLLVNKKKKAKQLYKENIMAKKPMKEEAKKATKENATEGLTAAQKKLPPALQAAMLKKMKKKK